MATALLVWLPVVLVAYYGVHKPFPPASHGLEAWSLMAAGPARVPFAGALADVAVAVWIAAAAAGTGRLLLRRLLGTLPEDPLASLVFGAGLGLGALALAVLALSAIQFLTPVPVFFLLGLFTGLALLSLGGRDHVGQAPSPAPSGLIRAVQACVAIIALLTLTQALTPPLAWDSLVYHLTGPKQYVAAGGLFPGLDIPHLYFPALVEQLFTSAVVIGGDTAAQVLSFVLAAATITAVFAFTRQRAGPLAGGLAVALLISAPGLLTLARIAYVEWGLALFLFLSFWALTEGIERNDRRWLVLSACLAGLALGVKYTAVFPVAGLALCAFWGVRSRGVLWCLVVALVASPWWLRDLALTGNPVYPFLFGGWNWDGWKAEWFSRAGTGLLQEPWRLLATPWDLTVLSVEGGAYDVDLGPLFLAFLPLLLIRAHASWAKQAFVVLVVTYAGWLIGAAQSSLLLQGRFLLPALPFLAAGLGATLGESSLVVGPIRVSRLLHTAVLLALVLTVTGAATRWLFDPPIPYLAGAESREGYLTRHLDGYYESVRRLPPEGRTLLLWEPRSYYCETACQPDALLYNWRYLLYRHPRIEDAFSSLETAGYSSLLLYGGGLRFFSQGPDPEARPQDVDALKRFEARYTERLSGPSLEEVLAMPESSAAGVYTVYQLKP